MERRPEQQESTKGENKWLCSTSTHCMKNKYCNSTSLGSSGTNLRSSQGEATAYPCLKTGIQREQVLEYNSHVNRGNWLGFSDS